MSMAIRSKDGILCFQHDPGLEQGLGVRRQLADPGQLDRRSFAAPDDPALLYAGIAEIPHLEQERSGGWDESAQEVKRH